MGNCFSRHANSDEGTRASFQRQNIARRYRSRQDVPVHPPSSPASNVSDSQAFTCHEPGGEFYKKSRQHFFLYFYRAQCSCGKVMFLHSACWDIHPPGKTSPRADVPGQTPPPGKTPPTATAVDGMHPTGIHSFFFSF